MRGWRPPGGAEKCYCVQCGAHLFSRSLDGARVSIRMAAFDTDPGVRPQLPPVRRFRRRLGADPRRGLERFPEARPQPDLA